MGRAAAFALLGLVLAAPCGARAVEGSEVYRRKCAHCHGADGRGGPRKLRPLADPEVQAMSDAELFDVVAKGTRDRRMPGFRGKLADDELRAAIAFVRAMAPSAP
ncbi:MAG TPA: cytochrome c [Anaeromyxobacteraceae bacterium]|jgi:mono/diheme cytochrome c family protein